MIRKIKGNLENHSLEELLELIPEHKNNHVLLLIQRTTRPWSPPLEAEINGYRFKASYTVRLDTGDNFCVITEPQLTNRKK